MRKALRRLTRRRREDEVSRILLGENGLVYGLKVQPGAQERQTENLAKEGGERFQLTSVEQWYSFVERGYLILELVVADVADVVMVHVEILVEKAVAGESRLVLVMDGGLKYVLACEVVVSLQEIPIGPDPDSKLLYLLASTKERGKFDFAMENSWFYSALRVGIPNFVYQNLEEGAFCPASHE